MNSPFQDSRGVDRLHSAVTQHWGLDVPAERWHYLRGRIERLLQGSDGGWDWFHDLHWDDPGLARLAPLITVGETYFFRDTALFETLQSEILPGLIANARATARPLAIGSAGCSTGEEIYSIAILLRRLVPEFESRHLTLLGIDINREAVEKARLGRYGMWSFRETPENVKTEWFSPLANGMLQLRADVRRMVQFQVANLASADAFPFAPGAFDLLLCRNVLMYFHRDAIPAVMDRLTRALRPGGILMVAPSETQLVGHTSLEVRQSGTRWIFVKHAAQVKCKPDPVHRAVIPTESIAKQTDWPRPAGVPPKKKHEPARAVISSARSLDLEVAPVIRAREALPSRDEDLSLESAIRQAQECADRGQLPAAREWAERALRIAPVQSSAHLLLGVILHDQNDLAGAREAFKRAAFLDPDSVLAHFHLGMIALRLQQMNEARTSLQRTRALLQAAPRSASPPRYQGHSARDLQRMVQMMLEQIHG